MRPIHVQNECSKWDRSDLVRRLCHALDIARLVGEHLAATGYIDPRDPAKSIRPEKVVSETAVLLVAASSVLDHPEIGIRVRHLAEQLIPHARSERTRLGICLHPAVAWDYALPHVCLSRLGYRDSGFDELLRQGLNSQAHSGRERAPHRMLEQEWTAMGLSGPKPGRSRTPITARISILNHPMNLLTGTRDDVYAFTHALMYVTDFNLYPAPLPRKRSVILAEAEAMLSCSLDEQDYDLSGEILLSWPLTGKYWSPAAAFAFKVLAHVEDVAGFLPSPSTRIAELKTLDGTDRMRYLLSSAYHTAYVMGLLCAASLRPGFAPPAVIKTSMAKPGSARQILSLLDADQQESHWKEEFLQLPQAAADALGGFLINIALHRRAARRDFGGLREILKLAYRLEMANTPAASQAAEMLQRISTYARISSEAGASPHCDFHHHPEVLDKRENGTIDA